MWVLEIWALFLVVSTADLILTYICIWLWAQPRPHSGQFSKNSIQKKVSGYHHEERGLLIHVSLNGLEVVSEAWINQKKDTNIRHLERQSSYLHWTLVVIHKSVGFTKRLKKFIKQPPNKNRRVGLFESILSLLIYKTIQFWPFKTCILHFYYVVNWF